MKIFESNGKINFVDNKNVFVGFDSYQDCCEHFGYILTKKIPDGIRKENNSGYIGNNEENLEIEGYNFDRKFFQNSIANSEQLQEGGVAIFKLKKKNHKPIFLILYNSHNGYYGHGFEVEHDGIKVQTGTL